MNKMRYLFITAVILCSGILSTVQPAFAESYAYLVRLEYTPAKNQMVFKSLELIRGSAPSRLQGEKDGYTLRLLNDQGEELYFFRFLPPIPTGAPPKEWFDSKTGEQIYVPKPDEPGELSSLTDQIPLTMVLPYLANARRLQVLDPQGKIIIDRPIAAAQDLAKSLVTREIESEKAKSSGSNSLSYSGIWIGIILTLLIWLYFRGR